MKTAHSIPSFHGLYRRVERSKKMLDEVSRSAKWFVIHTMQILSTLSVPSASSIFSFCARLHSLPSSCSFSFPHFFPLRSNHLQCCLCDFFIKLFLLPSFVIRHSTSANLIVKMFRECTNRVQVAMIEKWEKIAVCTRHRRLEWCRRACICIHTYMSARGLLGNWLHKSDWRSAPSRAPLSRSCAVVYIWRRPGDFNSQSSTLNDSRTCRFALFTTDCCLLRVRHSDEIYDEFIHNFSFFLAAAFCDNCVLRTWIQFSFLTSSVAELYGDWQLLRLSEMFSLLHEINNQEMFFWVISVMGLMQCLPNWVTWKNKISTQKNRRLQTWDLRINIHQPWN